MKRAISLLLASALLAGSLAACAPKSESQTLPPGTTAPETTPPPEPTETTQPVLPRPEADPILSEVMPDNRNLILGCTDDWIELHNPLDAELPLDGYFLTDSRDLPQALSLAGMTIPAGGYLPVVLDAQAPFQLSEAGETIYLAFGSEILSELSFAPAENGASYDRDGLCAYPTPGFANTEEGYLCYLDSQPLPELAIWEAMPTNRETYWADDGYFDWVEVKNTTDHPIALGDYSLTNSWDNRDRFCFPDEELAPGELRLILCSGSSETSPWHAPFKLPDAGSTLYLSRQGRFSDALVLPENLRPEESFGRMEAQPVYLAQPTPGEENSDGFLKGIAVPAASIPSGQFTEPVTVELSGEGTIYYTLNGTRPSRYSRVYTEPIVIDDVTTIRTFCVSEGRASQLTAYTYVVGPGHELPVVVLSIPDNSLYGGEGILSNVRASYEYEGQLTLIEDNEEKFSVPCGFRLHGNDSRLGAKKNFQLRFRGEYGASKLRYPVFDSRNFDEYDSLLLKGGSEDWDIAGMRDEIATGLVDGTTNLYAQAMRPVVFYLGGEYWGVYYLRERFSEYYVASHMDVSPESVDILYSSAGYVQVGNSDDFQDLKTFTKTHNMRLTENYNYLAERIDVTSLIDWYVCRTFVEDTDLANIRRCRSSEGDGKWHWMYFDLDWSFYSRGENAINTLLHSFDGDRILINALLESEAGRDAFFRRYAYLMRTVLNEENIVRTVDSLTSQIASEMPRDRDRWNRSVEYWQDNVQDLRDFDKNGRRIQRMLRYIQDYFGLSDGKMEYYFGEFMTE